MIFEKKLMKISKLTDYGMVIMAFMAKEQAGSLDGTEMPLLQAREISEQTSIALPTVSKLLKKLTKNKLLLSERGTTGGYKLAQSPKEITVAYLIEALEGRIALTQCNLGHNHCPTESLCAIRTPWLHINDVITKALTSVKLSDLIRATPFFNPGNQYVLHIQHN